ncbi:hypothetical protein GS571_03700 [Rhodococcus hoagii]|nr:hypothetical protein [Prescottella equi]
MGIALVGALIFGVLQVSGMVEKLLVCIAILLPGLFFDTLYSAGFVCMTGLILGIGKQGRAQENSSAIVITGESLKPKLIGDTA